MENSAMLSANFKQTIFKSKDEKFPLISKTNSSIDRGWAWMVLAGSLICHFLFVGQFTCFGVLYVEIREKLNISVVEVSIIGSLRNGLMYFIVVFTSPLCDVVGCRRMALTGGTLYSLSYILCFLWPNLYMFYIFLGVVIGFSSAMVYSSSLIVINNYFEKRRSFGLALTIFPCSVGGLLLSPLTAYTLDTFGLEGTLLINAGLGLHILVGGMLYFPQKTSKEKEYVSMKQWMANLIEPYKERWMWTNRSFYVMMTSSFCVGFGIYIPLMLLPDFMVSQGVSMSTAALSVTLLSAVQMVTSLLAGVITNNFPRLNRMQYIAGNLLISVFLFLVPVLGYQAYYLTTSGAFGFCYGIIGSLRIVLLIELFGPSRLPVSFGLTSFTFGIASITGAPFASYIATIVPITGIEYVVGGLSLMCAGLLLFQCPGKAEEKIASLESSYY